MNLPFFNLIRNIIRIAFHYLGSFIQNILHKCGTQLNSVSMNLIIHNLLNSFYLMSAIIHANTMVPIDLQMIIAVITIHEESKRETRFCQN